MTKRAFTMIELLVVVAVIGLLLGLLLPAVGGARRRAHGVVCASNCRQLHLANDLYAHDYGGRYMPGAVDIQAPTVMSAANLHRWHGMRDDAGQAFDPEGAPITEYLETDGASRRVRECPSFAATLKALEESGVGFERSAGGYGYNNAFVGTIRRRAGADAWVIVDTSRGSRASDFRDPTGTVAFADAALVTDKPIEYSFVEPPFWPEYAGFRPDPSVHFRHDGLASVVWLDGHVDSEALSFTASSGIYPMSAESFGVGWFGGVEDNALFDYE